ncbi:DUF3078 domain-containing protein [Prevotella sp. tf2-5]|uniref:DUF3078 domain-containing protein n=1 Tax=Prevotella sp. tf2-5 TaxID=1761889 RepID=UPI002100F41A|nr:DUF3078 domain-containing protein [Prevotella sp. tf2-5]
MMKYRYLFLYVMAMLVAPSASAQKSQRQQILNELKGYVDSIQVLRHQLDSIQQLNDSLRKETVDGRYYRLFAPPTFYHSGANKVLSLHPQTGDEVTDAIDEAMMGLYMRRPDLVQSTESQLRKVGTVREDVNQEVKQSVELVEHVDPVPVEPEVVPTGIVVTKPNFWKFKGDGFLQFLQNYVTGNWYKGGESNYSAVGAVTLELNYNDKDKYLFENKLEMKLGFQTSRSDTVHKFKTNNDLLRLTSKLGIQASKKWYYSLQLLAYTQFAKGLKANDEFVYSDIVSPLDVNVGLGMEYKVNALKGRLTGTLNFLPLAYNLRYVGRTTLFEKNGMDGRHTKHEFGAQFTGDLQWKIIDQITWKTRLYAYTSYKRALIEWENQIEFKVTKYISANLFLYPRFDDAATRDEDNGYFQFMEYSSLGLSYSF